MVGILADMKMSVVYKSGLLAWIVLLLFSGGIAIPSQDLDASKGDALLKAMSRKLAAAQTFSFSTTEFHDAINRLGKKVQINITRDLIVRRPNGFYAKYAGDLGWEFWYDGKLLTGVNSEKKVYVQREMPATLDEAMDMLAVRLNMDLPMSDVLYSSPYDAFMDAQTKGGFSGVDVIQGSSCGHLMYTTPAIDWQLWIDEKSFLPCQLEMTYKKKDGTSFYRINFSNWNLSAKINENTFSYKIPEGYVRIPILERVKMQPKAVQTQTQPDPEQE
jgi:hypothetical protein